MPDSTLLSHIILDHSDYKLIYFIYFIGCLPLFAR